jgi:hypothetical protein
MNRTPIARRISIGSVFLDVFVLFLVVVFALSIGMLIAHGALR